jgi:hypothetical protein
MTLSHAKTVLEALRFYASYDTWHEGSPHDDKTGITLDVHLPAGYVFDLGKRATQALSAAEALVREAENTDAFKQSVIEKIEVLRRDADADGSRAAEIAAEAYADCLQILKGE